MKTNKRNVQKNKPASPKLPLAKAVKKSDLKPIVNRIRDLRLKNNWSQGELAGLIGLSATAYASAEQMRVEFAIGKIIALKTVFKTTYNYLFEGALAEDKSDSKLYIFEIEKKDMEIKYLKRQVELLEQNLQTYKNKK